MSKVSSARLTWAAALLFAFSDSGCSGGLRTHVVAEVLAAEFDSAAGEQEEPKNESAAESVAATQLRPGDVYRLTAGNRAIISLVPGITAVAHDSAELQCDELVVEKDGNETGSGAMRMRRAALQLRRGGVTFALPWKDVSGRSEIEITLPNAKITGGFGSLFHVACAERSIRVTCVRLALQLTNGSRELDLQPGQTCEIRADGGEPSLEAAAANPVAQDAVQAALADEERISLAMAAKRAAVPTWRHP